MASSSHRRRTRPKPDQDFGWRPVRGPLLAVAAVAAVALVVTLVVAFRPGAAAGVTGQDRAASGPASEAVTSAAAAPKRPSPKPSTPSPAPTGSRRPPASPKPSAAASGTPSHAAANGATRTTTAPAAGRIRPGAAYRGVATSYDAGNGDGACSFGPTSDVLTAAMNTADYETAKACGAYVAVRTASGTSVTVRITNECPAPCAVGQLDLSRQAFAKLAPLSAGRIAITWSLLSPAVPDTVSIRYKTGSSRYWCGIQAIGHRNPLARLEVRTGGGWLALTRTGYNYFLSEHGTGCGGEIRLTDIYGEQLTVPALAVRPDVAQRTGVQFSRH
ncbi:RlpA-like double-psi beta-barrel domain-containing protein [Streptomyces sp. 900105755]|uniref:RlpA-like double-psi beta-barrel domain-containing protein n=1 Tax=Streptomyces sp. Ag109_O5-10 TaxID=1855349 RepID=UPI000895B75F|nr:RlpA-like double-psi beta-barrel domain-containing protein [Streptomyces sp. Ag109_O5-10]SEE97466.1 Peptidoglycan-binding domain-containing protein, expansin [Streptomyces sp. Ag109_O5-10]